MALVSQTTPASYFNNELIVFRNIGKDITAEEHEDAMQRMRVYEQWFLKEVMQVEKFSSFLMSQSEDVKPMYRDDLPPLVTFLSTVGFPHY